MSIASKCTCGKSISGWCANTVGCENTLTDTRSILQFFSVHDCTETEKKALKAFLFAYRHNDIDTDMLERIIKKYSHLL
jgi:hypothetical protein